MSLEIANADMILAVDNPTVVATITQTGTPSVKTKLSNKGAIEDGYGLSVSAITAPGAGATIPDAGPYSVVINATAIKVKSSNKLACRKGDKSDIINATPQIPGVPPTPYPVSFQVEITDAGQIKAKAV